MVCRGIVQLVERRSPKPDVVGSSPTTPVSDFLAQWFSRLERRPVTAEVRGSSPLWVVWALSSAGRAPALQAGGHRFEPCSAHTIADMAQLAEQLICNQQVIGSIPIVGLWRGSRAAKGGRL